MGTKSPLTEGTGFKCILQSSHQIMFLGPLIGGVAVATAAGLWQVTRSGDGSRSFSQELLLEFEKFNDWSRDV